MANKADLVLIDECAASVVTDDPGTQRWIDNYLLWHRHRLADDLGLVEQFADREARIAEFGAAPFFLSLALAKRGYNLECLDLAPDAFTEFLKSTGLPVRRINFEVEQLPCADESFDVVLFNEVFEHLRINPIATMREVRRVLKPGGTLLLSTPNCRSLRGLWTLLRHHTTCHVVKDLYDEYNKLLERGYMGHVREYTAREVSGFLTKVGFRLTRIVYRDYGPPIRRRASVAVVSSIERAICVVAPSWKPLFTVVCEK